MPARSPCPQTPARRRRWPTTTAGVLSPSGTRASADTVAAYIAALRAPLTANQAMLGPLSGATIRAYCLDDLDNPVGGTLQAASSATDLAVAGTFELSLAGIPDDDRLLVTAAGGEDIDADDDGVPDHLDAN